MSLSFLVITAFIFLFFMFIFIRPDPSGNIVASNIVGGFGISDEFSIITLVLAFVTLLVFLGILFFVYKKLISKRHKFKETGKPPLAPKKDVLEGLDKGKDLFDNEGLDKEDAKNIPKKEFPSTLPQKMGEPAVPVKTEKPIEKKEEPKPEDQKVLTNLNQLKSNIIGLLNQRHSKQDILRILESKGWSVEQIVKSIDEINLDSLRAYVKKSLSLGFDKDRIADHLRRNGWDETLISRAVQK